MTRPPDPGQYRGRTVVLPADPGFDPVTAARAGVLFADADHVLVGYGQAAVLELPGGLADAGARTAAQRWLATVRHDGADGGGRVTAFGALGFDPTAPGRLVVPELVVGADRAGSRWATAIARGPEPLTAEHVRSLVERIDRRSPPPVEVAAPLALRALPVGAAYADAVAVAVKRITAGELSKVVLARTVEARFAGPVAIEAALRRLQHQEPSCTTFSFPAGGDARFVGASPELLVARRGAEVACHPLAGTVGLRGGNGPRDDDAAVADFVASAKEQIEHRLVVDAVVAALEPRCDRLTVPPPTAVRLRSVVHLGTLVTGTLRPDPAGDPPSVLDLLADLHPTPAVGGVPTRVALDCIASLEPERRGLWAGPVGWVDADGDGRWMIGIRSATVHGDTVRLTAGAGIVDGSDPEAELAETTVKLAPVLEALAPGSGALVSSTSSG